MVRKGAIGASAVERDYVIKDYYVLLGVGRDASPDEVKKAFRAAAMRTHPDVSADPGNHEKFILLREAYDILGSPGRRAEYDRVRDAYYRGFAEADNDRDSQFRDIFSNFDGAGDSYYGEEWDYFVRNPDDYLSLFDSFMKSLATSFFSVCAGVGITAAVFLSIVASAALAASSIFLTAAAIASSSFGSLVLFLMMVRAIRKKWTKAGRLLHRILAGLGRITVAPLRGIPRAAGIRLLYFNYAAAFGALAIAGYFVFRFVSESGAAAALYRGRIAPALVPPVLALLFSISLPLIYEVITHAFFLYPDIIYTRAKIKKRREIEYRRDRFLSHRGGEE